MACIDFSELVPGATVTKYDGNMYDAVETIIAVTGKSRKNALRDIRDLKPENFDSTKIGPLKLKGAGNHKTFTVHGSNLVEFIMVIPGEIAKSYRQKFANIVTRYLAGDASLHSEIQANAASSNPICEMAREALSSGEGDPQVGEKRSVLNEGVSGASGDAGVLVKRLREATDIVTGVQPVLMSMKVDMEATAVAMEKIVKLKNECWEADGKGRFKEMEDMNKRAELEKATRAKEMEDMALMRAKELEDLALKRAKELEDMALKRAKEREDILAKAKANAEAIAIVAEAKRKARALAVSVPAEPVPPASAANGPYPNVAGFLPEDYTTVEKVYSENKGLHVRKADKSKHLNEAKLEVLRLYRAEFDGVQPKRVMCEISNRLVEMYPKSWTGLKAVLVDMIRHKKSGFGQKPISSCFARDSHIHLHLGHRSTGE